MTEVELFDSTEEAVQWFGEAIKAADARVHPWQAALMPGDCFVTVAGDDLVDLPLMRRIGLSIAVADAHEIVKAHADLITTAPGGAGAVREICEALLKSQGRWESILKEF